MSAPTLAGGVIEGLDEETYFAHPALSHSGAKVLLKSPARFAYEQEHGRPDTRTFDFGHAAHSLVLGKGAAIAPIVADSWRTNAAKEARDEARAAGLVPLLDSEYHVVLAMAAKLREHPLAGPLLEAGRGHAEQSLFWDDDQSPSVKRRARIDWTCLGDSRVLVVDYKSTVDAHPDTFNRSVGKYGYASQGAWYLDGVRACGLSDEAAFILVAQEKTPPYLVSVIELDSLWLRIGADKNRKAIDLYARCIESGHWPGFTEDEPALVGPPNYIVNEYTEDAA